MNNKAINNKIIIWECPTCKDVQISNPRLHHQMDSCKCGSCSMDLETDYSRISGFPKELKSISLKDMDIFSELGICCLEQGFYIELEKRYLELNTFLKIKELEKEILLNLLN